MNALSSAQCRPNGWLDTIAVCLATLCAVHCLLTPVLMVTLPVLATAFWAQKDFHLWMVLLVLPLTTTAVFLGCRKHKDKAVLISSAIGLCLLASVASYEAFAAHNPPAGVVDDCCASEKAASFFSATMIANLVGGLLLASGHVRNFWLCREASCDHE